MHDRYFLESIIVKKNMLVTCSKLFEIVFHGSYMRIIPQHVSGHVRDTCMKILGINKCIFTCWLHVGNVSELRTYLFRPQWHVPGPVFSILGTMG